MTLNNPTLHGRVIFITHLLYIVLLIVITNKFTINYIHVYNLHTLSIGIKMTKIIR